MIRIRIYNLQNKNFTPIELLTKYRYQLYIRLFWTLGRIYRNLQPAITRITTEYDIIVYSKKLGNLPLCGITIDEDTTSSNISLSF